VAAKAAATASVPKSLFMSGLPWFLLHDRGDLC
jgi:hypothetical protein